MLKDKYDIVIVGGGPAGLNAAFYAAQDNLDVAVMERSREIGIPIRCAEAVSKNALEEYSFIDDNFISTLINNVHFIAPNNELVEMKMDAQVGYILDRREYEQTLAKKAAEKSATICTRAHVRGVQQISSAPKLIVDYAGQQKIVETKLLIAADGIESNIAPEFGIKTTLSMKNAEACYQMKLTNLEIPENTLKFWFTNDIAPGGYIWAFPKGPHTANVGLGKGSKSDNSENTKQRLERFVKRQYPKSSILNTSAGGVSVSRGLDELVADHCLVAGDAARMINPLTGGGIATALWSGKKAGLIAKQAILDNNTSEKFLEKYEKAWKKEKEKDLKRLFRLKEALNKLTDEDFNQLAAKYKDKSPEDVTLTKLFTSALKNKPGLISDVVKLLTGV